MGAMLRDSVVMDVHAMHPQANAANQDDHEKGHAWVSFFYAWFIFGLSNFYRYIYI